MTVFHRAIAFPKRPAALRDQTAVALRDAAANRSYAVAPQKHGLTGNSAAADLAATSPKP